MNQHGPSPETSLKAAISMDVDVEVEVVNVVPTSRSMPYFPACIGCYALWGLCRLGSFDRNPDPNPCRMLAVQSPVPSHKNRSSVPSKQRHSNRSVFMYVQLFRGGIIIQRAYRPQVVAVC